MKHEQILICGDKPCSKKKKARRLLEAELDGRVTVCDVGCQKICDGPVVGLRIKGSWEWFKELSKGKVRSALLDTLETGKMPKSLKRKRVKSRSGKRR